MSEELSIAGGAGGTGTLLDETTLVGGAAIESAEEAVEAYIESVVHAETRAAAASVTEGALIAGLGAGCLTPEMVLAVARRRLNDLDTQIDTVMTELDRRSAQASEISRDLGELRNASSVLEQVYDSNGEIQLGNNVRFPDPADPSGSATLTMTASEYLDRLGASGVFTASEIETIRGGRDGLDSLIDTANDRLRDVNSGNEMLMIQLQSTMQTRTSVIQTATNLLKTMDEGSDSIVGNLR